MTDSRDPDSKPRPYALAPRRQNRSEAFEWPVPVKDDGHAYVLTVGFRASGAVREIFIAGHREGSDIQGLIDDACVAASLAMQMGIALITLARHLGRQGALPDSRAASVLGEALRLAVIIEAEDRGAIASLERALRHARNPLKAFE